MKKTLTKFLGVAVVIGIILEIRKYYAHKTEDLEVKDFKVFKGIRVGKVFRGIKAFKE